MSCKVLANERKHYMFSHIPPMSFFHLSMSNISANEKWCYMFSHILPMSFFPTFHLWATSQPMREDVKCFHFFHLLSMSNVSANERRCYMFSYLPSLCNISANEKKMLHIFLWATSQPMREGVTCFPIFHPEATSQPMRPLFCVHRCKGLNWEET